MAGIASSLLEKGHEAAIWDFDAEPFTERLFTNRLKEYAPALVGVSCYTPTIVNGHKIAALVKEGMPGVLTVVGGPHVSALPRQTLEEFKDFDIGVIGEGEEVMVELADKVSRGEPIEDVKGIIHRHDGQLCATAARDPVQDLDKLPYPARGLLNIPLYKGQSHRGFSRSFLKITEIMTSRGCPNRCIFCASDVIAGRAVRFRSAESVKDEIAECVKKYGFNHFTISDDTFALRENRLYDICGEFSARKVTWNCNARVQPLSRKTLSVMAESGCAGVTFGVESGSPRILKLIEKNITLDEIEDAFRWSKEAGIKLVEADVIIGSHPSETMDDIDMTKRLLAKISPDVISVSIIVPYPGTAVYEMMRKGGLISQDKRWDSFVLFGREPSWRTENFDPRELVRLQKDLLASFYFRPSYILNTMRKMKSLGEFLYWIRGGTEFLLNFITRPFEI